MSWWPGPTARVPPPRACPDCKSPAIRSLVQADIDQAVKAGVESTPSFVVGEFMLRGAVPYADFAEAIDTALVVFKKRMAAGPAQPAPGR